MDLETAWNVLADLQERGDWMGTMQDAATAISRMTHIPYNNVMEWINSTTVETSHGEVDVIIDSTGEITLVIPEKEDS